MNSLLEKLTNIQGRAGQLREWLDLEKKEKRINELELLVMRPDFWGMPEQAAQISQELADLKEDVALWQDIMKESDDLIFLTKETNEGEDDFWQELEEKILNLEKKIDKEELKIFLAGKNDKAKAILTISAGQGGHDAEDFVRMLFKMYVGYFEDQKWPYEILHQHYSEESGGSEEASGERGFKNISLEVKAKYAYGYLKNESGTHRLVRVSPFDAKKLRHTSFALVEVLPEVEEIDLKELAIEEKDLKFDFFRSSGPGGQNVNKRETAVRVVHLPTGLSAACQTERSQAQNRDKALILLKLKLFDYLKNKAKNEAGALKKRVEPSWGNQIRNYVLHPYKLVKDLRTGMETNQVDDVFEGKIDDFIQAGLRLK